MVNITLEEVSECVLNFNFTDYIVESASKLLQELFVTEEVPKGYLRHDTLLKKSVKEGNFPRTCYIFMQALFNAKT